MDFQDDWRRAVFSSQFLVFSGRLRVGKGAFFCLNQDLQDFEGFSGWMGQGRHLRGFGGDGGRRSGWTLSNRHLVRISKPGR